MIFLSCLATERLFEVLDLLAHLLDDDLQRQRGVRHFNGGGLGAEGVGLAVHFLHDEVKSTADGAALIQNASDFGHVRVESVDFLLDVHAHGVERHFLTDAVAHFLAGERARFGKCCAEGVFKAFLELALDVGEDFGHAALDFGYDFFNLLAVVEEHAGERLAFAGSGGGEGVERVVEHGKHGA